MSDNLRERVPDTVPDDVELVERDGIVYGQDEHGEFKLDPIRGDDEPREDRCGEPLTYYMERYGHARFCGRLPESTFTDGGSDRCHMHKSRESLMERAHELFEHGYFAVNYVNFSEKLAPEKFLFAVEMFHGLVEESKHEFEIEEEVRVIDTESSNLIEEDEVAVSLPLPTATHRTFEASELWMAALDEVKVQNMQEAVFGDGVSQKTIADSADMDGKITDKAYEATEHHLHLPISRLTKDIKEHLKNGGVDTDDDDAGVLTFQRNEYTLDATEMEPEEEEAEDSEEVQGDFAEHMSEIEVE